MDTKPHDDNTSVKNEVHDPHTHKDIKRPAHKKSKKWIPALLLAVVLIAAASGAFYFFLQKPQSTTVVNKKATQFSSPSTLITEATSAFVGSPIAVTTNDSTGGTQADGYYVYNLPSYRTDVNSYFNKPVEGTGAGYAGDSVATSSNYKKLTAFFDKNNFSQIASLTDKSGYISASEKITYTDYAMYQSPDMVCAISDVDATPTKIQNHISYIACASKASYKQASDNIKPFLAAYLEANKKAIISELTFANPDIQDAANGYKNVVVYQDDLGKFTEDDTTKSFFQGYYYKAPAEGNWMFLASSPLDTQLTCSQYVADAAKKAFAGSDCIDDTSKKVSIVK